MLLWVIKEARSFMSNTTVNQLIKVSHTVLVFASQYMNVNLLILNHQQCSVCLFLGQIKLRFALAPVMNKVTTVHWGAVFSREGLGPKPSAVTGLSSSRYVRTSPFSWPRTRSPEQTRQCRSWAVSSHPVCAPTPTCEAITLGKKQWKCVRHCKHPALAPSFQEKVKKCRAKENVRESVSRSMMRSWTVAIAAHLTPLLINYHLCLSSAVPIWDWPLERGSPFVSTAWKYTSRAVLQKFTIQRSKAQLACNADRRRGLEW